MPPPLRPLMEDADTFFYTVWLLGRFSSAAQSFVLFLCGKVFFLQPILVAPVHSWHAETRRPN